MTAIVNSANNKLITKHTILAAFTSVGIGTLSVALDLQEDLIVLKAMESSPLADAAIALVESTILYCTNNTPVTKANADKAREVLADMLINSKTK